MAETLISDKIRSRLQKRAQTAGYTVDELLTQWLDADEDDTVKINHQQEMLAEIGAPEEYQLLRAVIDHLPDYIFVKDADARFIMSNVAHAAAAGLTPNDLIGKTASETFDNEVANQFHDDDLEVLRTGEAMISEERVTTNADGERVWVLTTKVPLRNGNGEIKGLIGISRNITDLKEANDSRLRAEKLWVELQKEKELNEIKSHFVSTVSHEFRTPLTVIMSSTGMLQEYFDRLTEEKRARHLQKIVAQVQVMVELIEDTLTISKAQVGQIAFNPVTVAIGTFCRDVVNELILTDEGKHFFEYTSDLLPDKTYSVDTKLFRQILVNLLSNAIKYTPEGGNIRVDLTGDGDRIILTINDNGIGIPEKDHLRLFDPFHRGGNVRNIQGTGLGLAIAKHHVELHKGVILFDSQVDVGSTFTVRIPA